MKRKRFAVEQITGILKQAEFGMPIAHICRQHGISEQSYYRWKKTYGGMEPSEARELKQLRDENTKLKRLVADLSLDKVMLQDVVQKQVARPVRKREVVRYLIGRYGVSARQACRCVRIKRSVFYYESIRDPLPALRQRIRELAHARVRFGYRRILVLLQRERWGVGKKCVYRLYREEGLALRRKRPWRHVSAVHRLQRQPAARPNDIWSMDFVADQLADGRRFRTLTVVDLYTRECLAIEVGKHLRAENVVQVMNQLKYSRGLPQRIYCDNGSEFVSGQTDLRAYSNQVQIDSAGAASQPIMPSSRASMGASARSA